jgi:phosphatidylglycerophosphate synthase
MTVSPSDLNQSHKKRPSLDDIRACQPRPMSEGIFGFFERQGSLPISWFLVQTPVSANQITVVWWAVGILGALLLSTGQYFLALPGALLFLLVLILDDVDGEVARYKKTQSLVGVYLDLVGHNVVKSALFVGMSLGCYGTQPALWIIFLGISASLTLVIADNMRFYRTYLLERNNIQPIPSAARGKLRRNLSRLQTIWRSQGLYLSTVLGALTGGLIWVLIFYGLATPVWMLIVLLRSSREFGAITTPGKDGVLED